MKYPQLVSTRAVNAISDWLVSRLEQLGVEAPQIYSRLLLSLLQSSVQINDPIEFSNLETFFAYRKGSNRRYPPCEPNTLKKINAVQCLREIVSFDQEIAAIEALVDELLEKLIDIEKQSADVEDDDSLVANLPILGLQSNQPIHHNNHHKASKLSGSFPTGGCTDTGNYSSKTTRLRTESRSKQQSAIDSESDPKKRYFRAFPALTKEMEDSFRVLKRNSKSLTWPVEKSKNSTASVSSSDSGLGLGAKNNSLKLVGKQHMSDGVGGRSAVGKQVSSNVSMDNNESNIATVVKRRTRRRRNQALSKGKNIRKNSCGSGIGVGSSIIRSNRSLSPFWDTDFEGCWEMGRDLIKEFIVKQNNRNRSTSESAAYTNLEQREEEKETENLEDHEMLQQNHEMQKLPVVETIRSCSSLLPPIDISFCCNGDIEDDTLASISEITDASLNCHRRLYKRDTSVNSVVTDDQLDFAQFKAKFDSSLEALWKNVPSGADNKNENCDAIFFLTTSSAMQSDPLSAPAPQKDNLQSFWSNYYNHRFDLNKITQERDANVSDTSSLRTENSRKVAVNTSDYCSMPCNLEEFNKSAHKCDTPVNVFLQNSIWSDGSNGISAVDTDESFFKQIWNSSQKTNTLGAVSRKMDSAVTYSQESAFQMPSHYGKSKWSEGINAGPDPSVDIHLVQTTQQQQHLLNLKIPDFSTSSSTISTCSIDQVKQFRDMGSTATSKVDNRAVELTDSTATSASTTSCSSYSLSANYNWQTPLLGQSLQPDMQSWSSSNPMSLTEMYGGDNNGLNDGKRVLGKYFVSTAVNETVTLPNHSSGTSGFIEYARIKLAAGKGLKSDSAKSISTGFHQPQHVGRSKDCYSADEDLLNSDLTHFRPIKPYEDGHSFYICSALDVVEYERSQSGYLYWESEKYLEYTRKDPFLAEEESTSTTNVGAPLYASSNCAANSTKTPAYRQCDFVMKFRLRNCDASCQTEAEPCLATRVKPPEIEPHPLCLIFSSSLKGMPLQTTGLACNDAIEALNKAVAAAAEAAAATRNPIDDSHWLPSVANYRSVAAWPTDPHKFSEKGVYDEFDFATSKSSFNALEQWSMHEIGKKCELYNENNGDAHTLWGMCAACNNELKSVPANRLLKDELQMEADEIMRDLKYMQNLYIGEGATADSDSDWDTGEPVSENMINGCDVKMSTLNEGDDLKTYVEEDHNESKIKKENIIQAEHAAQDVFNKVNRLIVDLLCRDSVGLTSSPSVPTHVQFLDSLWSPNDKNNVWQQANVGFKSIDLLKSFNDGQQSAYTYPMDEDKFLNNLSWEHDNLAEIWEKTTPPLTNASAISKENPINVANEAIDATRTVNRNFKNLFDVSASPSATCQFSAINSPTVPSAYKRVQEFLDSNVSAASSKFKSINRKRRHSASQNLFHISLNNNNNLQITDLNQFDLKAYHECNNREMEKMINSLEAEPAYEDDFYASAEEAANIKQPKQTIITCKYWTTIDPITTPITADMIQGSAFSCLINKNASILKHVTMLTRPLTR